jgi:hypothetical protein
MIWTKLDIFAGTLDFDGKSLEMLVSFLGIMPSPRQKDPSGLSSEIWGTLLDFCWMDNYGFLFPQARIIQALKFENEKNENDEKLFQLSRKSEFERSPAKFLRKLNEFRLLGDKLDKSLLGVMLS